MKKVLFNKKSTLIIFLFFSFLFGCGKKEALEVSVVSLGEEKQVLQNELNSTNLNSSNFKLNHGDVLDLYKTLLINEYIVEHDLGYQFKLNKKTKILSLDLKKAKSIYHKLASTNMLHLTQGVRDQINMVEITLESMKKFLSIPDEQIQKTKELILKIDEKKVRSFYSKELLKAKVELYEELLKRLNALLKRLESTKKVSPFIKSPNPIDLKGVKL
jgi:hypothetical protein